MEILVVNNEAKERKLLVVKLSTDNVEHQVMLSFISSFNHPPYTCPISASWTSHYLKAEPRLNISPVASCKSRANLFCDGRWVWRAVA